MHHMLYDCPPLQLMTWPLMKLASSEARNAMAAACSSGRPRRRNACWLRMSYAISRWYAAASDWAMSSAIMPGRISCRGVNRSAISVPPGAMVLILMP